MKGGAPFVNFFERVKGRDLPWAFLPLTCGGGDKVSFSFLPLFLDWHF